ncbi:MAG TPA: NUDIX hydrolase [Streptosporangiaceae bacterium]|nr:NUDIX hydrolase [Streptosporangiaceae bacterium]
MTSASGDEQSRWRAHGERAIYDSPWVWLGQVDVELPDGQRIWHHVVRLRRAVVMLLLDDQDRVLMLWRHRFIADRWGWELPGGLVEDGEDPAEAAQRELAEETGYRAGRIAHLITFQALAGLADAERAVFTGQAPQRVGEPTDTTESERLDWIPLPSVPGLIAAGQIWTSGTLVGLLQFLAGRPS